MSKLIFSARKFLYSSLSTKIIFLTPLTKLDCFATSLQLLPTTKILISDPICLAAVIVFKLEILKFLLSCSAILK